MDRVIVRWVWTEPVARAHQRVRGVWTADARGDLDQRVVEQEGQAHLLSGGQAHLKGWKHNRL